MKSILFVDDERAVLDALRFTMHRERERWNVVFAPSAMAALKALEANHFDVVVSDLNMPEMDGVELLERVRASHPSTVRIIMTGNNIESTTGTGVAHEVLSKPCPVGRLRSCLERWLAAPSPLE
jgi:DNA-binding NtrC family response regulator